MSERTRIDRPEYDTHCRWCLHDLTCSGYCLREADEVPEAAELQVRLDRLGRSDLGETLDQVEGGS